MAVLGAASGGGHLPQLAISNSMTWVPPIDGNVCIHVIGGGGGGEGRGTGYPGGAGGYCKKNSLAVTTAGSFTIVVGAGGNGGSNAVGSNGGNSTVAGTGLSATLTANGGYGGGTWTGSGYFGFGGSASNGDVNNTGGNGGNDNAGNGGAVGVYGTGANGSNEYGRHGDTTDAQGEGLGQSGYGYIVGGSGSPASWVSGDRAYISHVQAGSLTGGSGAYGSSNNMNVSAGSGGIGGGGGGAKNASYASHANGGDGGDGIVLIQYLP